MNADASLDQYRDESGQKYHRKRAVPEEAFLWIAHKRAKKFAPHIRSHDVILELGAGAGWNLATLVSRRKLATEPSLFLVDCNAPQKSRQFFLRVG